MNGKLEIKKRLNGVAPLSLSLLHIISYKKRDGDDDAFGSTSGIPCPACWNLY